MSKQLQKEIERRRTFGIISHPDAGKTTLTEKLLLFGGAIQMAGAVKARKASKHALSDWMAIEKDRGISVTSSVMKFEYADCEINLLDTPGHHLIGWGDADYPPQLRRGCSTLMDQAFLAPNVADLAQAEPVLVGQLTA